MFKSLAHFTLAFLLVACASGHQKTAGQLRRLVLANKHDEAIALLKKSPLAEDKKSELLFYIELGILQHYKADYQNSILSLNAAKSIVDSLYTTKASGKLASAFSNDNADYYYSEKYEASLVHFYLGLNHYILGDLEKARAEVLAWDTFITEMKNDRVGNANFKDDLLAKTFGAFIHEAQRNNKDDQIALQLYKDAADVFYKNYNLYPTFNSAFLSFRENFKLLPTLAPKEIEGKYVRATKHTPGFQEFLTYKILQLTKKVRPSDLKNQMAKFKPSKEIMQKVNENGGHVTFLIQDGLIVEKEAKKYEMPMLWGPQAAVAMAMNMGNTIQFELPVVKTVPQLELATLKALNAAGEVVAQATLTVIAPLDDIAEQAINEHSTAIASKTAARVAAKHLAALVAAQAALRAGQNRQGGAAAIGLLLGTIGHAATIAAINESEKADIRFWSTLPSNIRMGQLALPKGTYRIQAVFGEEGSTYHRVLELGEQTVEKGSIKLVMNKNHQSKSAYVAAGPEITPDISEPKSSSVEASTPNRGIANELGCMKDNECDSGKVCATVRGEYPGSCASK